MNKKYFGNSFIGLGIFGSVLGNVASANPLSDEKWAKYEKKLNDARKVKSDRSFIQKFLSYLNVFEWYNYYKDCKVKEYTDKNIAISREILGIFKDTFDLEALEDCKLTFANNTNVSCNYVSDYDQIFSLQKEAKLLQSLDKLFGDSTEVIDYVICSNLGVDPKNGGGVFEELETLLDNAIKISDERNPFIAIGNFPQVSCDWDNLWKENAFLKYSRSNIAIAKKILDILKDDFNIGEGAEACLSDIDHRDHSSVKNIQRYIFFVENELVKLVSNYFGRVNSCVLGGYVFPAKMLDRKVFDEKIEELRKLIDNAIENSKARKKVLDPNSRRDLWYVRNWKGLKETEDKIHVGVGDINTFAKKYGKILDSAYLEKFYVNK